MSRSYDIFLSHSGAQKHFVEHLSTELARVCGQYSVFFDRDAIKHGEQISTSILEYAGTCKLAVAVLSEEYFTRSRPPRMELAASYTAAKAGNGSPSLPCLLPVFFALRPDDAKDSSTQSEWRKMWQKWELNDKMSDKRNSRPRRVHPMVWKVAVDRLLDTRGPIYIPEENGDDPEVFLKKVAQIIARKLDVLTGSVDPSDKDVGPSGDTDREEDSSDNSSMDSSDNSSMDTLENSSMDSSENSILDQILLFYEPRARLKLMLSSSSQVAGKVTDEKEALRKPYSALVCLEFGCKSSSFSFSHISNLENAYTHYEFPGSGKGNFYYRTMTPIYCCSRDGGQLYQVESWGNAARSSYERDEREAGRSSEHFVGIYKRFGGHLTMKMIQWCVPVPSSRDNAAQEKMVTSMESAGLLNGADGSPYPVKTVGELEAVSFECLRCSKWQRKVGERLLVVDISESFFDVVVQEVVSVCSHVHRVKEASSGFLPRRSSPDSKFQSLLQCKIGPCFQELLTKHPTEYQDLIDQWDLLKRQFGDNGNLVKLAIFHKFGTLQFKPSGLKCTPVLDFRLRGLKFIPFLDAE